MFIGMSHQIDIRGVCAILLIYSMFCCPPFEQITFQWCLNWKAVVCTWRSIEDCKQWFGRDLQFCFDEEEQTKARILFCKLSLHKADGVTVRGKLAAIEELPF